MKSSNDENDVVPKAITYFYPDEQIKYQKLLDCGEIVGIVQYFNYDLFRSIARTFYFQKSFVAHEHYGRHSGFLCVPDDRYTAEEAHIYLKHILNVFNMLYGTWNHIQITYEKDDKIYSFLQEALTPIVNYVFSQHRTVSNLFSTIEYTLLKNGNQRVLLESKHYLAYLKSKYGLHDGFIGYDDKILYSTCDPDTTFYLQLLFQLNNELSENLITIPWESEFKLRNGVSLFRIYVRRPLIPISTKTNSPTPKPGVPIVQITTAPISIFDPESSDTDVPRSLSRSSNGSLPSSIVNKHLLGVIIKTDQSGSSEDTGLDTDDPGDELPPLIHHDMMSTSFVSLEENPNDLKTEESSSASSNEDGQGLTDEQKELIIKSRSSTVSDDREKTIEKEPKIIPNESSVDRIYLTAVESFDTSDDDQDTFRLPDSTRERTRTITSNSDSNLKESSDRHEGQVTWTNIPDINTEDERDELVLYIQSNSRMIFAGIIEQSLITDDYLNKLWKLMLSQMANMETEIQVMSTANEMIKLTTDVKFSFNENSRRAEYERVFDGIRYYRRIPSDESTYMALFARTELNRNPERKVIGLSRGSHVVSVDRRLSDRIAYSCQRYREAL